MSLQSTRLAGWTLPGALRGASGAALLNHYNAPVSSDLERPALACSTGSFWMWDLERTFGTIAEAGFTSVELMITRDPL
ncbi:MAG: hypothetical protein QOD49_23, partial [Actinomycetota bacterium]|nr:hypothetical protein [Actinomycetota bacterium]